MNKKLSLGTKLAYGVGDLYGGASAAIIGIFFLFFMTNVVNINPFWGGLIVLFGRIIDASIDPFIGKITDNTRSKYGRRTFWFLVGIVPVFVSYSLLWLVPDVAQWLQILYYFFAYAFYCVAFSFVMVPYGVLPQELTKDSRERSVLVAFRMACSILGGLTAAVLPDMIIKRNAVLSRGYMAMGLIFGAVFALIWVVIFLVMKGKEQPSQGIADVPFMRSLKICVRNKAFLVLVGVYLFAFLPIDIISANIKFYLEDVLGKGSLFSLTMGVLLALTVASLPIYIKMTEKIGKKKSFVLGSLWRCIFLVVLFFITRDTPAALLVAIAALVGLGVGASYALPWAMLPEITDLDEAATGLQQEGVYSGVMTFVRQLSSGAAVFLVGALLSASGYIERAAGAAATAQPASALLTIKLIITLIPIVLTVLGILCAMKYPINSDNFKRIREVIELRRSGEYDALSGGAKSGIENEMKDIVDLNTNALRVRDHYDALIDEINDPVRDPAPLREYMGKWDGEAFLSAMQLAPGKSVLEIGVGTGRLAIQVCGKCGRFTGIDFSPKTVERAKENLREFPNASLICADYLAYPFGESFDVIYSSLTFLHIEDKRAAIQKAADLLNPGGRFVLSIDMENQNPRFKANGRKMKIYPDTPGKITSLLTKAGLDIEEQFETEFAVVFAARRG